MDDQLARSLSESISVAGSSGFCVDTVSVDASATPSSRFYRQTPLSYSVYGLKNLTGLGKQVGEKNGIVTGRALVGYNDRFSYGAFCSTGLFPQQNETECQSDI